MLRSSSTQKVLCLADAHCLFARTVVEMAKHGIVHYMYGIAFHEDNFYVIAIPLPTLRNNKFVGSNHLSSNEAFYITKDATIGDQVPFSDFRLMIEGNRWEMFSPIEV